MSSSSDFDDDQHFTLANIPFGVVSTTDQPTTKRIATRLYGDVYIVPELISHELLGNLAEDVKHALSQPTLNQFASYPASVCRQVRLQLQDLLRSLSTSSAPTLTLPPSCKYPKSAITTHLPVIVGDFTDFSCSMNHVLNASEAMAGKRTLPPCFLHFPPGYSGRCSSIVPSGTHIRRPLGQYKDGSGNVVFGPSRRVDFELEIGAIVGQSTTHGKPVHVNDSKQHIFGLILLNDWSARDIQALEMQPLGPLNGKSFGSSISPWVITLDALQSFSCPISPREPGSNLPPYLREDEENAHYAVHTQVDLIEECQQVTTVCRGNLNSLYWSLPSLVAHMTSNGCLLQTGDILATGTISGSEPGSYGCLLESTRGGKDELILSSGKKRTFLQDGDAVRLTAWAGELGSDECVGFGESFGVLESAIEIGSI